MRNNTLAELRSRLDMTQSQLAEALGISLRAIGEYERGKTSIPKVVALACSTVAFGLAEMDEITVLHVRSQKKLAAEHEQRMRFADEQMKATGDAAKKARQENLIKFVETKAEPVLSDLAENKCHLTALEDAKESLRIAVRRVQDANKVLEQQKIKKQFERIKRLLRVGTKDNPIYQINSHSICEEEAGSEEFFVKCSIPDLIKRDLIENGVSTINLLSQMTESEVLRIPRLGRKSLLAIRQHLANYGHELSGSGYRLSRYDIQFLAKYDIEF
jgi:transcriptional regulator with XRE-family HTH domain